ncbi:MAG TPA: DNA polymerase III subunit beta [Steroidobacteraceae bacterium]|nr:DNA polymerase III subunit beta [Steroidobacteraceae bacterium]
MKFTADREAVLSSLQSVIGVIERRQTMPVLGNVLLSGSNGRLTMTATDMEVELVAVTNVDIDRAGDITVPGRKLADIVRALPEKASITLSTEGERATLRSGKSRFTLTTLPATDFPTIDDIGERQKIKLPQADLKRLIDKTHFSMAQQDVRYYLNGLLFEIDGKAARAVATDGHRLAMSQIALVTEGQSTTQVIVPRKAVMELQRLSGGQGDVDVIVGANHIRIQFGDIRFTSKLIDGRFPDYTRVVPADPPRTVQANRESLRAALHRTAILSNEKFRGIRLALKNGALVLQAHNPEQEEAEEEIELAYQGEELEIGFNVNYLMDALAAIEGTDVELGFTDSNSSCLLRVPGAQDTKYVVMPMRL